MIKHHIDKAMPIRLPNLPNGWRYASVSEVGASDEQAVMTGPFGTNLGRHDFIERGIPLLTISCLTDQGIRLQKALFVSTEKANELKRYRLKSGDLLFSRMASVGRAGIVGPDLDGALFNYHIMRLRLDESKLLPKFFTAYVRGSKQVQDYLLTVNHGATRDGINTEQLLSMPVIIAPIDEQRRIVAEIEKQFTRLNAGTAALRRAQANLKRYRAAVLKAACEGRLVPIEAELARKDGRAYESADKLLARILTERRKKWAGRGRYKEPVSAKTANFPPLPDGWIWASLDQLLLNITDGDHQPPPQTGSGVPFLVIGNVRSGRIDLTHTRYVSRAYADAVDPFRKPANGDILYTLVGSFGLAVRVIREDEFCIQRHIAVLRPHDASPVMFLAQILNSSFVFHQASAVATGTAQKTVPLAGLRRFAIPLPPLAEQSRIVAEVERRLSVVEEQEAVVSANLQRATRLRQSILQGAFCV